MKCASCGKPILDKEVVLRIENDKTKEVIVIHKSCLDKVGIG